MRSMSSPRSFIALLLLGGGIAAGIFLERYFLARPAPAPVPLASNPAVAVVPTNAPIVGPLQTNELAAAFAPLLTETNSVAFVNALEALVLRLGLNTFPPAMELATGIEKQLLRDRARLRFISEWRKLDRAGALSYLLSQPAEAWRDRNIGLLADAWAQEDPPAAVAWAEQPTNKLFLANVVSHAARALAEKDPEGALALADKLPASGGRVTIQHTVFSAWSKRDPAAAVKRMADIMSESASRSGITSRTLSDAVASWINLDAAAAAQWLTELPDSVRRRQLIQSAAGSFAKAKPAVGAALIQSLPAGEDRQRAIGLFAAAWAAGDANAAFKWARDLPAGFERSHALGSVLPKLATANPNTAAEFYLAEPLQDDTRPYFSSFVRHYAALDLPVAIAWAKKMNGEMRDSALHEMARQMAGKSPVEAVALTRDISTAGMGQSYREMALREIFSTWATSDAPAAAAYVEKMPAGRERGYVLSNVTARWMERDPPAAAAWLLALPSGEGSDNAYRLVVNAYLDKNPAQAAAFVEKLPVSEQNIRVLNGLVFGWAKIDVDACAAWVEKLPTPTVRQTAFRALAEQTLSLNPVRAAAFAEKASPDTSSYDDLRGKVALKWAASDPAAATAWAVRVATNNLPNYLSQLVQLWGRREPAAAVKFALDNEGSFSDPARRFPSRSDGLPYAVTEVMTAWSQQDTSAAAAWLVARDTDKRQSELGTVLVSRWPIARFDELVGWLKSAPAKPWRNTVVNKLVFELGAAAEYPEKFSQLIPLVDSESKQNDAVEKIGRAWLRKDRAAAEGWLATTKLPEDRKQKLLKPAK